MQFNGSRRRSGWALRGCVGMGMGAALLALGACSGSVGGGWGGSSGEGGGEGGEGGGVPPGPPPLASQCSARSGRPAWQLSTNTAFATRTIVGQVFGKSVLDDAQVKSMLEGLPTNQRAKGFDTENKAVAAQFTDGYVALAGRLATLAAEQASVREAMEGFVGRDCGGSMDLSQGCGQDFARDLASVLERDAVADEDLDFLLETYNSNKATYKDAKAYAGFVASVLMSAKSVLRFDSAEGNMKGTVDAKTLGARLAMTLTSGLPDAELRAKMEDGSLAKADTIRSEASRLMRTPEGRATLQHFAQQWLNVAELKSPPGASGFVASVEESAKVAAAARSEIGRLFEVNVLDREGGDLRSFFGTNEVAPAHDWLAKLYGASRSGDITPSSKSEREGLLTRVAFNLHGAFAPYLPLAHRGYGVRVTMLCGEVGALPDVVDTTLPDDAPDAMSSRQFFQVLTEKGACQGCHEAMNPYGYAMSAFSVTGEFLTREPVKNRKTQAMEDVEVLPSVTLRLDGNERHVNDATDLSIALGESAQAQACFAHRFDQYAVGKKEDFLCAQDDESPPALDDLSLEDSILAYVVSSAFSAR